MLSLTFIGCLNACGGGGGNESPNSNTGDGGTTTPPTPSPNLSVSEGESRVTVNLVDNIIMPTYNAMLTESKALSESTISFCDKLSPTETDLNDLKQHWVKVNTAWQNARVLKFGPIADTFYYSRIQFWPISSAKIMNDVEETLDQDIDFSEGFGNQKHQIQGLPAMEILLYAESESQSLLTAQNRSNRCDYLKAIAKNIEGIMDDTVLQWENGYGQSFKEGSGEFNSRKFAIEKFLTVWFEYLEIINDDKLKEPLGSASPGEPDLLENPISKLSLSNIRVNIDQLYKQYKGADGFGLDDYLDEVNNRSDVNDAIIEAFDKLKGNLNDIEGDSLIQLI
jgi:predicted lipoprotein